MKLPIFLRAIFPLDAVEPAFARIYLRTGAGCCALAFLLVTWKYGWANEMVRWPVAPLLAGLAAAFLAMTHVRLPAAQERGAAVALWIAAAAMLTATAGQSDFCTRMALAVLAVGGAAVWRWGMRAVPGAAVTAAFSALALAANAAYLREAEPSIVAGAVWAALHLTAGLIGGAVAERTVRHWLERNASVKYYRVDILRQSHLPLMLHRDGMLLMANDSVAQLFGYPSGQAMQGMPVKDLYDSSEHPRILERRARAKQLPLGQRLPMTDYKGRRADGSIVLVQAAATPVELPDGPALEALYVRLRGPDEAAPDLLKSDAMVMRLFRSSPVCVMVADIQTGRYLMVNPAFETLIGYAPHEVVGRTSFEIGIWGNLQHRKEFIDRVTADGTVLDMPVIMRTKDGRLRSILLSGSAFEFEGQRCLVSQAHDVTQIELERREVAAILDNASVGIAFTVDGRFMRVNRRLEEMLGWETGSLQGQLSQPVWAPEDAQVGLGGSQGGELDQAGTIDFVSQLRRRDGTSLVCHTRGVSLAQDGQAQSGRVWIVEDITERYRIARELELARDAAEAGSRSKSAFLANMSHEIRTPLHGVMGLAELSRRHNITASQRDTYLGQLIDSARALTHVISEVLDLSKIEAGQMGLELHNFDLHELAESVCTLYFPDAQTRGIDLELKIDPDVPQWVQGDAVRVRQILVNFSSNAMKFTARGSVTLRLGIAAGRVLLSVRDTGPGLDEWTCQRLFTPFMQADESTTRRFGGTGLGLSICRQLAQLMGGEVGVRSEPGRGSEFWASLPLPAVTAPQLLSEHGVSESALEVLKGTRVLVVEDNAVNMMIVTAQLEQWGVVVLHAGDGVEALEVLEREARDSIEVVLMDLQMPRMGGEQAVRELRSNPRIAHLPVIALTAAALVEEQERAMQAGFNDFITKPFESERLRNILLHWLRMGVAQESTAC